MSSRPFVVLAAWTWIAALSSSPAIPASPPLPKDPAAAAPAVSPARPANLPLPWDTMADAYVIPELPFVHDYSNAGYAPNYGTCCPYCYGPTPDVVYRFDPVEPVTVAVNLCNDGTDYDTVVYMWRNGYSEFVACNDDACTSSDFPWPYVSRIGSVQLEPGNAYYIVVGGYCGLTGNYRLTVAERDTLHVVRADGTGEFATIQEALDASYDGDVVELADGTYTGPGNRALTIGYKSVTLRSASGDPSACILDCEEAAQGFVFSHWEPRTTVIEGITIRRGANPEGYGGGVYLGEGASPLFRDCVIESCRARLGAGVAAEEGSGRFERCRFRQNWASENGGAVYDASPFEGLEMEDCTLDGNKAALGGGAVYVGLGYLTLRGCTLVDNRVTGASGRGGAISWRTPLSQFSC